MGIIPLKKPSSLPELPETLRMVPMNEEKTLYKAVPEYEEEQLPEQEPIEETESEPIPEPPQEQVQDISNQEPVKESKEETTTVEEVLISQEQRIQFLEHRLQSVEAALFRIKGAI